MHFEAGSCRFIHMNLQAGPFFSWFSTSFPSWSQFESSHICTSEDVLRSPTIAVSISWHNQWLSHRLALETLIHGCRIFQKESHRLFQPDYVMPTSTRWDHTYNCTTWTMWYFNDITNWCILSVKNNLHFGPKFIETPESWCIWPSSVLPSSPPHTESSRWPSQLSLRHCRRSSQRTHVHSQPCHSTVETSPRDTNTSQKPSTLGFHP